MVARIAVIARDRDRSRTVTTCSAGSDDIAGLQRPQGARAAEAVSAGNTPDRPIVADPRPYDGAGRPYKIFIGPLSRRADDVKPMREQKIHRRVWRSRYTVISSHVVL